MLFSGLACFSPSVPAEIRRLWVKEGGKLTHTDADFRKAEFFFCDGMKDPWLTQLLSRSVIVRHAVWVSLCVAEDFVMPIADYTLDENFDESRIIIRKPAQPDVSKSMPATGKRTRDHEEDEWQLNYRPTKKPRTEALPSLVVVEGKAQVKKAVEDVGSKHGHKQVDRPSLGNNPGPKVPKIPPQISLAFKHAKNTSHTVKMFERRIIHHPKTLSPPPTPAPNSKVDSVHRSSLNPYTLFWNDLLAKSLVRECGADKTLTLKIVDLLDAPGVKAGIFAVNDTFLGRKFINKDYQ